MERDVLVSILKFAAAHKADINSFVNALNEEHVEQGKISIPDQLISEIAEGFLKEKGIRHIVDPLIVFDHGYIFVACKIKKLMTISLSCAIEINNFVFNKKEHFMLCSYNLLGSSLKNIAIHDTIKNFGRNPDLRTKGIVINANSIAVSFDKLFQDVNIPEWLTLTYVKCDEGELVFHYKI